MKNIKTFNYKINIHYQLTPLNLSTKKSTNVRMVKGSLWREEYSG